MATSITGFENANLSEVMKKSLIDAFIASGHSQHSGRAETVWAIQEYCREAKVPFRIEVARFEGRPVGARVVRTDKDLSVAVGKPPADWVIEVAEEWSPAKEEKSSVQQDH